MGNVAFLAVPGLLLATALTAGLSLILPDIAAIKDTRMRIYIALIFGSIISATDPVAVVAMLKELGLYTKNFSSFEVIIGFQQLDTISRSTCPEKALLFSSSFRAVLFFLRTRAEIRAFSLLKTHIFA